MHVRAAEYSDSIMLSDVLDELFDAKKRTRRGDPHFVREHYIDHPHRVQCSVAVSEEGRILGFQSLKRAHSGNPYDTPIGWGIIGTHVRPSAARQGVGSHLFRATLGAARRAALPQIEAFIGAQNLEAIAYYEAIGFRTYRYAEGVVCKKIEVG